MKNHGLASFQSSNDINQPLPDQRAIEHRIQAAWDDNISIAARRYLDPFEKGGTHQLSVSDLCFFAVSQASKHEQARANVLN